MTPVWRSEWILGSVLDVGGVEHHIPTTYLRAFVRAFVSGEIGTTLVGLSYNMTVGQYDSNKGSFMPAKILVFCNKKGGPGKTTLAMNIGATLAENAKVLVIDADSQQSAVKWADAANEDSPLPMVVMGYYQKKVHQAIKKVADQYDYILVDTPPSSLAVSTITRSALIVADLAIVPVAPSPLDVWETMSISELLAEINEIREAGGVNPLQARLVVNKLKTRTTLGAEIKDALDNLGIPVLDTSVHERECYKHAVLDGCSIYTLKAAGASGKAAAKEIRALTQEILNTL